MHRGVSAGVKRAAHLKEVPSSLCSMLGYHVHTLCCDWNFTLLSNALPSLSLLYCQILQSNKINRMPIQETVYYEAWTDMITWPRRPKICHLPPADRGKPRGLRITGLMVRTLVWVRRFEKRAQSGRRWMAQPEQSGRVIPPFLGLLLLCRPLAD